MTLTEARRARWAVAAMFLANGFTMGAWAPQIPLLLPRHDITEAVLGLLILGLGIGAVTAMLFSGRLIARFGTVPVLRALPFRSCRCCRWWSSRPRSGCWRWRWPLSAR